MRAIGFFAIHFVDQICPSPARWRITSGALFAWAICMKTATDHWGKEIPGSIWSELRDGMVPDRTLARRLLRATEEELPKLLACSAAVRDHFRPGVVTYSRKVFIPLTNLCRDYCGYCTFRRDAGEDGAHTMTPDEVLAVVQQGERLGCREALFSLGDKPEAAFPEMRESLEHMGYSSTLHYLEDMCAMVLSESTLLPHANPGLMSGEWVHRLSAVCPSLGLMLESTSTALLAPGGAHDRAPDKPAERRLHTLAEAGKRKVPFTTGLLIGIGESPEDRVDSLLAIRDLHQR